MWWAFRWTTSAFAALVRVLRPIMLCKPGSLSAAQDSECSLSVARLCSFCSGLRPALLAVDMVLGPLGS